MKLPSPIEDFIHAISSLLAETAGELTPEQFLQEARKAHRELCEGMGLTVRLWPGEPAKEE